MTPLLIFLLVATVALAHPGLTGTSEGCPRHTDGQRGDHTLRQGLAANTSGTFPPLAAIIRANYYTHTYTARAFELFWLWHSDELIEIAFRCRTGGGAFGGGFPARRGLCFFFPFFFSVFSPFAIFSFLCGLKFSGH